MAKVTISSVIDAPVEQVWARIRDFNGLPSWHPRMVESHIEDGKVATTIGCVRNFQLASGARLREKLLDFSDDNFLVSYSILETPQPQRRLVIGDRLGRLDDGIADEEIVIGKVDQFFAQPRAAGQLEVAHAADRAGILAVLDMAFDHAWMPIRQPVEIAYARPNLFDRCVDDAGDGDFGHKMFPCEFRCGKGRALQRAALINAS